MFLDEQRVLRHTMVSALSYAAFQDAAKSGMTLELSDTGGGLLGSAFGNTPGMADSDGTANEEKVYEEIGSVSLP